jgi:peroxiredoxin family protein
MEKEAPMDDPEKRLTLIVFSNDFYRATAAFILATGAASSGMQVTLFFTFWGLSLLRMKGRSGRKKTIVERMFGWMLPVGPGGTSLSKMHFLGLGTMMMKGIMRKKRMPDPAELMETAASLGVKLVACTTSMGIMGIGKDELREGIEYGGVATYLNEARGAGVNLFV